MGGSWSHLRNDYPAQATFGRLPILLFWMLFFDINKNQRQAWCVLTCIPLVSERKICFYIVGTNVKLDVIDKSEFPNSKMYMFFQHLGVSTEKHSPSQMSNFKLKKHTHMNLSVKNSSLVPFHPFLFAVTFNFTGIDVFWGSFFFENFRVGGFPQCLEEIHGSWDV